MAEGPAPAAEGVKKKWRRGHVPLNYHRLEWIRSLEDDDSAWSAVPYQERLKNGGATVPPEYAAEVERIAEATKKMSFEELREETKRAPGTFKDNGDVNDARSDAFWDRINEEFWAEATKDVDYLFELYEDLDEERENIRREKKLMDDMFPGGEDWLHEVERRRMYYNKKNENISDDEEEFDDEQIKELHQTVREKASKGEDPFPNSPKTRKIPDETVTGIVNEEDENADIRYGY